MDFYIGPAGQRAYGMESCMNLTAHALGMTLMLLPYGLLADDKPVTTMEEALARPVSFSVKRETFQGALQRLAEETRSGLPKGSTLQFDIRIINDDLKSGGFTRNMPVDDLALNDQPLRTALTALLMKANHDRLVTDPSDPRQWLVWVVGADSDHPESQVILITTRQRAGERGDQLPEEFTERQ